MRKISTLLIALFVSAQVFADKDSTAVKYAETIKSQDLSEYLHVLASDSLEGREAGELGQKKAAEYLRSKFKEFGLAPVVETDTGKSYYQTFTLVKKQWDDVYLKVGNEKKEFLKDFYAYGDFEIPQEEEMEMAFAGYGIDADSYSSYENLDVKGKGVLIFMGEPVKDGVSLVTGSKKMSEWAFDWRKKAAAAKERGAEAVYIVVGDNQEEFEAKLSALKHHLSEPTLSFTYKQREGSAFFVPAKMAAEMLETKEEKLFKAKDKLSKKKPAKIKTKSALVKAKVGVKKEPFQTENVLGFIEGTDRKDEVVVITAHYDHLGKKGDKIYYGADDDGSGTAGVLEMAQAFAKAKEAGHGPSRSILFMPVTAEEKGLLGSEYYTDNPVFPLEKTVTNLNIDMIGRMDTLHDNPDYIYLIGSNRLSTTLHEVSEKAAEDYLPEIDLDYRYNEKDDPNRFYYRSDHYNFAKNNIPVIFYFSGVHEDYHQPTDTVDKIDFEKMEKISRLVFYTAWDIANHDEAIEVDVQSKK